MESNQTIPINKDYKVLVGCMTYNHSKYIVDALNGFAMQQTNFPFACIVIDDASTDGEPEVIKDWLQNECDMERADFYDLELASVFIVPHQTNANCTMAVYFLKRNLYNEGHLKFDLVKDWGSHCEYLALCEGDDYWTGPEKLQIQSDCLDAHPEVDMCAHQAFVINESTGRIIGKKGPKTKDTIISFQRVLLFDGGIFATGSVLYRKTLEENIPKYRLFLPIDNTLFCHGAMRGGVLYFQKEMSVYRRFVPNSWTSNIPKNYNSQRLKMFEILDEETNYYYHPIILAIMMREHIVANNSKKDNLKFFLSYRKGFLKLDLITQLSIIIKCLIPRQICKATSIMKCNLCHLIQVCPR